jgi:hypothetical protein
MQFNGANIIPNPIPIKPEINIAVGMRIKCIPKGNPYAIIIGIITKLLIIVITMLANIAVAGKMILGKNTR